MTRHNDEWELLYEKLKAENAQLSATCERLEAELRDYKADLSHGDAEIRFDLIEKNKALAATCERYRSALIFYADTGNCDSEGAYVIDATVYDNGATAKEALESGERGGV